MTMILNPFPIQWLALLAYFLLRVCVAGVLLYLGMQHYKYRHELKNVLVLNWFPFGHFSSIAFAVGEIAIALFLLIGAYTQYAALAVMLMSLKMLVVRHWFNHHTIPPKIFYVLLLGASVSLFITGAGVLAVDLPL